VVTAPAAAPVERVEAVMQRRRGWIRRRLREVAQLPPPRAPREWVSGETHYYLGRQYRLRIVRGAQTEVKLAGRFFWVSVAEPSDPLRVRKAMERWFLQRARITFERRIEELIRTTPRLRLKTPPPLLVRKLRKRWGSCSADGRVLMNVDAVKLPAGCVDYLLLHELCHIRVPHHGPAFWRLLDACMPEWERWRKRLDRAEL
jgi:predicted metal-dependent hydrolase